MLNLAVPQREKGKWKVGQTANPGGRPRRGYYDGPSVAELARMYTADAVKALVLALHYPPTRVPAAVALLDRGWGKPEQSVAVNGQQTVLHLHLVAAQMVEELEAAKPAPVITGEPPKE